ncbi:DUF808 domain-containing protein [Algoriphagus sp. NBT04N3]|jgi:uncharacterized protein|uniref:DUF808 domain-containing protein n=1 Tax=Algoriphagus sp. NBT04N3 TaxID=2705473 RepID=UPI001C62E390|nr:DUF808 domain-containing protein [Algoriphagus sp. NBT04N3]QYH39663.1 DUF808 domain-containing protein [Algoriphagus sp. NBT04N3]
MASGLFALLDDVATLMDDVASMTKVAAKKTAGILGDDLAVNAEKASGFVSNRELPVLWAITKGSLLNKIIILPLAFLLSAFLPVSITIILIIGGIYLAYEGALKVMEWILPEKNKEKAKLRPELSKEQILALEKKKIKSAITTDFILSVEIIIITLGAVEGEPFLNQILVVTLISLIATVGVYGLVAVIVRMDEMGQKLINWNEEDDTLSDKVGMAMVVGLPYLVRFISIVGTIALFLVAGGIFTHKIDFFHHLLTGLPTILRDFLIGFIIGILVWIPIHLIKTKVSKKN